MPDIIIVGGGLAGLIAGNRAAELGRSVLILEQGADPAYLCNSRIATGAMNFAHSNPERPVEDLVAAVASDTDGHADPALARAIAAVAGRGLQWLRDNGAQMVMREVQNKQSWLLAPVRRFSAGLDWPGSGADLLMGELTSRLAARGGELRLATRAHELILDQGRVCGVVAQTAGQRQTLQASAVILADGGFQADAAQVGRSIAPHPTALVQRSAGTGRGDGIRMAAASGARLLDMDRFYGHLQSRDALHNPSLWPYPTLDSLTGGSILINRAGHRQFDEGLGGILLANLIAATDDPLGMTIIFDEPIWTTTGLDEVVPANPQLVEAGGTLLRAATLDALAAQLDIPPDVLNHTVATYNDAIRQQHPETLQPPRTPGRRFGVARNGASRTAARPVETPPFYAAPLSVGITCTLGGIAIDTAARALHQDGHAIPGLYAIGSNVGGIEGGPSAGYIGGLAKAYCTALIAAESIAKNA